MLDLILYPKLEINTRPLKVFFFLSENQKKTGRLLTWEKFLSEVSVAGKKPNRPAEQKNFLVNFKDHLEFTGGSKSSVGWQVMFKTWPWEGLKQFCQVLE